MKQNGEKCENLCVIQIVISENTNTVFYLRSRREEKCFRYHGGVNKLLGLREVRNLVVDLIEKRIESLNVKGQAI